MRKLQAEAVVAAVPMTKKKAETVVAAPPLDGVEVPPLEGGELVAPPQHVPTPDGVDLEVPPLEGVQLVAPPQQFPTLYGSEWHVHVALAQHEPVGVLRSHD